ncbi:uncharacterized protein LOC143847911 [Tasmannia lanceolata]|uniref:uncharacterized protein LOC143847911 n=1 Tax=Tasmannia lanceolata TaxID=3420 RepID=UPI004062C789
MLRMFDRGMFNSVMIYITKTISENGINLLNSSMIPPNNVCISRTSINPNISSTLIPLQKRARERKNVKLRSRFEVDLQKDYESEFVSEEILDTSIGGSPGERSIRSRFDLNETLTSGLHANHVAGGIDELQNIGDQRSIRSECFNAVLKDARKLLIASLVEHTQGQTTQFIQKHQKLDSSWHTKLTHYAEERMESSLRESCQYTTYQVWTHEFKVKSLETTDFVDLITRTCSCCAFQTYGLPCGHAIAAINITEFDLYDYCDECFDAERYQDTYAEVVHATLDRTQWHESPKPLVTILPPLEKRQPGRPSTRGTDIELKGGLHYKCTRCRQLGHNRRSCKEPLIVKLDLDETTIGPSAPILTRSVVTCQAPFFA